MTTLPAAEHYIRLGIHSEQQFLETNKDKYDTVVINGNLAHYFASATATLLGSKLKGKGFIIDPVTHAFGHHPRYIMTQAEEGHKSRVKSSIQGLGELYGPPVSTAIAVPTRPRAVTKKDFSSEKAMRPFAENVLAFQAGFVANSVSPEDRKYFIDDVSTLRPNFLIAPYFYMESSTLDDWLEINLDFVKLSKGTMPQSSIYAEIVIDRDILDKDADLNRIISAYGGLKDCDGFLLWVSDLTEQAASLPTLKGMKRLVADLSKASGKPIVNLFGGYFSLLLTKFGLTGVCHGPGYGEERDVVPVGGGLPTSKFYLTPVHQRLLYREVAFLVQSKAWKNADQFHREICNGKTCRDTLQGNLDNFYRFGEETIFQKKTRSYSFPTTEARIRTTHHYLEAKNSEFDMVAQEDLAALLKQLQSAKTKYDPFLGPTLTRYLQTWVEALGP
jgi:hypothetical protein